MPRHIDTAKAIAGGMIKRPRGGTLIVVLSSMGDLLLASGAISRLAASSGAPTRVLINEYAAPVTDVLSLEGVKWTKLGSNALSNLLRLVPVFRRRWDRVIHLTFSTTLHAHEICSAAEADEKIWFNGDSSDEEEVVSGDAVDCYTKLAETQRDEHELDKLCVMLNASGCPVRDRESIYPVISSSTRLGKGSEKPSTITVCPGGRFSAKKWPNSKYAELIVTLMKKDPEAEIVLLGGPGDAAACAEIENACSAGAVRNLCGRMSVRESIDEIAESSLCVGNDSFALHAAIAVGTPSVVVMGGGQYPRWIPWKDTDRHRMVTKECQHRGCGWNCVYGDYRCVGEISVDEVINEIVSFESKAVRP